MKYTAENGVNINFGDVQIIREKHNYHDVAIAQEVEFIEKVDVE